MKALILETSTQKNFLLLADDGKLIKGKLLPGGSELSRTLGSETKALLGKEKPDWICVGQGPGSYTGTRVGAALAKGLSFGWQIPLYGFCSLLAFAPPEEGTFAVLLDAKMGGIYVLLGEKIEGEIKTIPSRLVKPEELPSLLQGRKHIVSPAPSDLTQRNANFLIQEADPCLEMMALLAFTPGFQTPLELAYLA